MLEYAYHASLLDATTITTAVSATATTPVKLAGFAKYAVVEAVFTYGSGGTTTKCWLQTTVDGTTWIDIASLAFTTSTASKVSALSATVALAAGVTPTDGTLADNTIVNGLLGSQFRLKYVTTGTYAGGTTLKVDAVFKG